MRLHCHLGISPHEEYAMLMFINMAIEPQFAQAPKCHPDINSGPRVVDTPSSIRNLRLSPTRTQGILVFQPHRRTGESHTGVNFLGGVSQSLFCAAHIIGQCHEHYLLAKQFKMPDLLKNHKQPRNRTNDNAAVAQSKAWKKRCVLESALLYASLVTFPQI